MRPKENWMKKGAEITKDGAKGKITNFHTSIVGTETYVHSMNVQMDGVKHAFPINPNDIDPYDNTANHRSSQGAI